MAEAVAHFVLSVLSGVPAWLKIIVLAMVPVTEYQLAIPYAVERFYFSPAAAYALALGGSALLFFPLFFGLELLRAALTKVCPPLLRPLDAFLLRAEHKLKNSYEKYGALALFFFLAIPFPFTGIWTATTAAVVLKIPFRGAAVGIFLGVLVGQAIVLAATLGIGTLLA
ncbi:MAG: small multi-drug export protein [Patescibacteria group bacterium]|jgi:uncharacterized membrane protein